MSLLDPIRRATGLTAAESAVVIAITVVFVAGWIGRSLQQPPSLHHQEAAERVLAMLDSIARPAAGGEPHSSLEIPHHTVRTAPRSRASAAPPAPVIHRMSINSPSVQAWEQLPGIGPSTARAILAEQRIRPFQSIDDLQRVRGIGPKKLDRLRPYLTVP